MSNVEAILNFKIRSRAGGRCRRSFNIRISGFFRHSSFWFRHCPEPPWRGCYEM